MNIRPNDTMINRSVSGVPHTKPTPVPVDKQSKIKRFLNNVVEFFKRIFFRSSSSPRSESPVNQPISTIMPTSIPKASVGVPENAPNVSTDTVNSLEGSQAGAAVKSDAILDADATMWPTFMNRLIETYGEHPLQTLQPSMEKLGMSDAFNHLSTIVNREVSVSYDEACIQFDQLLVDLNNRALAFHRERESAITQGVSAMPRAWVDGLDGVAAGIQESVTKIAANLSDSPTVREYIAAGEALDDIAKNAITYMKSTIETAKGWGDTISELTKMGMIDDATTLTTLLTTASAGNLEENVGKCGMIMAKLDYRQKESAMTQGVSAMPRAWVDGLDGVAAGIQESVTKIAANLSDSPTVREYIEAGEALDEVAKNAITHMKSTIETAKGWGDTTAELTQMGMIDDATTVTTLLTTTSAENLGKNVGKCGMIMAKLDYTRTREEIFNLPTLHQPSQALQDLSDYAHDLDQQLQQDVANASDTVGFEKYCESLDDLKQKILDTKQALQGLLAENGTYQTQLTSLKKDMLKSTQLYVNSGEFNHKRLTGKLYDDALKRIRYVFGQRESAISDVLKRYFFQKSDDDRQDLYNQLVDLYAEKHFHLMASTVQGDLYLKGWDTQGRPDAEIEADILNVLGNNPAIKQAVSRVIDPILSGLSTTIQSSSQKLVDAAFQNDALMATMRTLHQATLGIDMFVHKVADDSSFTDGSLSSIINGLNQTSQLMDQFSSMSKTFILGEHDLTHLDNAKVGQIIEQVIQDKNIMFSSSNEKDDFVVTLTDYVLKRAAYKGDIYSADDVYGTIQKQNIKKVLNKKAFDKESNKHVKSLLKGDDFSMLNDDKQKNRFGKITSRGPYNQAFLVFNKHVLENLKKFLEDEDTIDSAKDLMPLVTDVLSQDPGLDLGVDAPAVHQKLCDYLWTLLILNNVIFTGDAGLVKTGQSADLVSQLTRGKRGRHAEFKLKSKSGTAFYKANKALCQSLYSSSSNLKAAFDDIEKPLESAIQGTLATGREQGLVGRLRGYITSIKRPSRLVIKENVAFKAKVFKNRLKNILNKEERDQLQEDYEAFNEEIGEFSDDASNPTLEDLMEENREKLDEWDETVNEALDNTQELATQFQDAFRDFEQQVNRLFQSDSSSSQPLSRTQELADSEDSSVDGTSNELVAVSEAIAEPILAIKAMLMDVGHMALDEAENAIMSIPYVGALYSAYQVGSHIKHYRDEQSTMATMAQHLNAASSLHRYTTADNLTNEDAGDGVRMFSSFLTAEKKRDAAKFALAIYVANAVSPPGVNAGAILTSIKNSLNMPELDEDDMNHIAKEVMTINKDYHVLARGVKGEIMDDLFKEIGTNSPNADSFAGVLHEMSRFLPDADEFSGYLTDRLFIAPTRK